jgi:hypothetical protein
MLMPKKPSDKPARVLLEKILGPMGMDRPTLAGRLEASTTLIYSWVTLNEHIQEKWWPKLEAIVVEWEELNGIRPTPMFNVNGIVVGGRVRQKVGTRWEGVVKAVDPKDKMILVGIDGATSEWVESKFLECV